MESYIGQKINHLTITGITDRIPFGKEFRRLMTYKCDCGNEKAGRLSDILSGKIMSCGCYGRSMVRIRNKETNPNPHAVIHGLTNHPLYDIYYSMIARCYNEKRKDYYRYGGRGITVCEEWRGSFVAFFNWCMANGYESGLAIDRRENDSGYSPENCRFVTCIENANNTRKNLFVEYNNEKFTLAQLARKFKMNPIRLRKRIVEYKWTVKEAVETPLFPPGYKRKDKSYKPNPLLFP
jgi:hypothetical protein